ncbi:MAG TPA: carboxypeptidase-like regulatory domain-containing protein, partial [Bryobacteraceae bacterium]|nr:carboxypeptidase-like regulatory domain-containing protein [Bryobacteraceae bacterium]
MSFRTSTIALGILTGAVYLAPAAHAGSPVPLTGELLGQVQNNAGVAQMGAKVFLYNRYDQVVRETLTNDTGKFAFEFLAPDVYSIRVALASFVPALRRNIAVTVGSRNLLKINLSTVLSTVDLVPPSQSKGTLMTDDWKWVLRTSQATRPVLRLLPDTSSSRQQDTASPLLSFSGTTGMVTLSAGDSQSFAGSAAQDMGTAFALATVVNGSARVRLSGNVGYVSTSGLPATGFRATYSHTSDEAPAPQISFTAHQIYLPGLGGAEDPSAAQSAAKAGPVLRMASFAAADNLVLGDRVQIEYGGHVDALSFLQRESYVSPFLRATYEFGKSGSLRIAYSSGAEPTELIVYDTGDSAAEANPELNQDLAALSQLPQMSRSDGRLRLQRTRNVEAGYDLVRGSRKYSARVYRENVADAAFTMSTPTGFLPAGDLLPDFASSNYIFDAGDYDRTGYSGAVTQSAGDHLEFMVAGGRAGALVSSPARDSAETAAAIRSSIRQEGRLWVTLRASATVPRGGTRVVTSYGWTDFQSL